jgi:polysaccharide export outer membrane protein
MRHQLKAITIALFLFGLIAGCGTQLAEPVTVAAAEPYRLDNGDQLRITVFGQETMSGEFIVDGSGHISMPLIEQVEARGRTAQELEGQIAERMSAEGLLVNPSVSVQILTYRPFFILGEVAQPGEYVFTEGMTVLTAVAKAGGFTYRADDDDFSITRNTGAEILEENAQRNTPVKPGDVVYVHQRVF